MQRQGKVGGEEGLCTYYIDERKRGGGVIRTAAFWIYKWSFMHPFLSTLKHARRLLFLFYLFAGLLIVGNVVVSVKWRKEKRRKTSPPRINYNSKLQSESVSLVSLTVFFLLKQCSLRCFSVNCCLPFLCKSRHSVVNITFSFLSSRYICSWSVVWRVRGAGRRDKQSVVV